MSVHDATLTLSETLASSNAMGTVGDDWYSRLIMATVVIKNNTPIVLRDTHAIAVVCAPENNIVSVYYALSTINHISDGSILPFWDCIMQYRCCRLWNIDHNDNIVDIDFFSLHLPITCLSSALHNTLHTRTAVFGASFELTTCCTCPWFLPFRVVSHTHGPTLSYIHWPLVKQHGI